MLLVCDELGLIGREMFAVDGVKLPSSTAKGWSGTRADFAKKVKKLERAVRYLARRHREADARGETGPLQQSREKQIETLRPAICNVKRWLKKNEDKLGAGGRVKKSNITDDESAKMKTGKGVIQGYDGVTVTDTKHRVVVHAQAYGEAQEHALLVPMLEAVRENFRALGTEDVLEQVAVAADSGFRSEANVKHLFEAGVDGCLADTLFRKRDYSALPRRTATCLPERARLGRARRGAAYSGHRISTTRRRRPASARRGSSSIRTELIAASGSGSR